MRGATPPGANLAKTCWPQLREGREMELMVWPCPGSLYEVARGSVAGTVKL